MAWLDNCLNDNGSEVMDKPGSVLSCFFSNLVITHDMLIVQQEHRVINSKTLVKRVSLQHKLFLMGFKFLEPKEFMLHFNLLCDDFAVFDTQKVFDLNYLAI